MPTQQKHTAHPRLLLLQSTPPGTIGFLIHRPPIEPAPCRPHPPALDTTPLASHQAVLAPSSVADQRPGPTSRRPSPAVVTFRHGRPAQGRAEDTLDPSHQVLERRSNPHPAVVRSRRAHVDARKQDVVIAHARKEDDPPEGVRENCLAFTTSPFRG
ncbi:hypothetical protein CMUS01_14861 [Colletotrichum musicola]|uniref:Uncharacterized protein n=1 Tax=Colletotrichum musicola TaxID=2175873 RepID=A0A8H6J1K3_9PEZI|nr:hypothetical protein CMUS01_14861 [Colletotrichum musicola]